MANNGDIRQKIVLEGEKEYSAALKEAQRNLKVLRSELKAETAELGKNASEQQKNEVRTKNLQKQIKEQEKVVRTYEKALEEVRQKYGDNEEAVAKWEVKLNEARTALAGLKNGLDDTSASMNRIGSAAQSSGDMGVVAMNSLAQSLERVGSVGDTISSGLESAFSSVIGIISSAITDLWADVMEVAGKANGWTDMAAMFGASTNEIQQWENTLKAAGKDFSVLGGMMTRLARGKTDKGIAEWLNISSENYENELEYTLVLLGRLKEAQGEMSASAFNKKLTENFKGSESDIRWFLANWDYLMEKSDKYDAGEGGFGLTEEQIEQMNQLYLKVEDIKTSWQALKSMALVKLTGDLAMNLSGNVQAIIEAFKEYFDATDDAGRDAALQKVRENIEEAFKAIKAAIEEGIKMLGQLAEELQNSGDPAVRAFGKLLDKIVGVLEWFADENNWDTVKRGFEALIGVWASGKVLSAISNIAAFASHVKTILGGGKTLFGWGGGSGAGAGAGAGSGAGAGGGTAAAGAAGKTGFFSTLASGFADAAGISLGSALIGTSAVAAMAYGLGEFVKSTNASWRGQVQDDAHRYDSLGTRDQQIIQTTIRGIMGGESPMSREWQMRWFAQNMGSRIWDAFNYTDAGTGEQRNRLGVLLGTNNAQSAEAFALIAQAYGLRKDRMGNYDVTSSDALRTLMNSDPEIGRLITMGATSYAMYQQMGNGVNYANLWSDMTAFFEGSMMKDENGQYWTPVLYDMMRNMPTIPADSWNGETGAIKTELSDGAEGKLSKAVAGAVAGIRVYIDGAEAGHLLAPYVSQEIAYQAAP